MDRLWHDFRYAVRWLHRSTGFKLTEVFPLALGLGATAAVYSVTHILRTFLSRGLAFASVGIALGAVATWMASSVVSRLLLEAGAPARGSIHSTVMNHTQAAVLSALAILAVTISASWVPAFNAASSNPWKHCVQNKFH